MATNLGLKRSETSRLVRKVTELMLENEKKREQEEDGEVTDNKNNN